METIFLVIFVFLFFHKTVTSINTMAMPSSNVTCIQRERESLLLFKQALTGSHHLLSTWNGLECCAWHGVGCDNRNGHVVKLDLRAPLSLNEFMPSRELSLGGELSPSLQNLKHLRYIDLSMNCFSGNIPEFLGSFERLEYLNLSASCFRGVIPHHLGNLSRLQYLDLRYFFVTTFHEFFYLEAPMVDDLGWVSSLLSLKYLDLSGTHIGNHTVWFHPVNMLPSLLTLNLAWLGINIPDIKFINFTSLNSLDLSYNDINSTIPIWLTNLTGLMNLNLASNHLHGKIPDFLGMFSGLASIDLSFNSFQSSMPNMLSNLSSLVHLDLSWNRFYGPIPASLGLLKRLDNLYLHNNQLSGHIPLSLWKLLNLKILDLSLNSLVGDLSETHFSNLSKLKYLGLSLNLLTLNFSSGWIAPFQLHIFYAGSCNMGPHFPNWLQTQTNLQRLELSNSGIRDIIPEWFENILAQILYLDLSYNQISGKLPRIHFVSGDPMSDGILMMNSNKFEGSLATFPSNVRILDLSDNLLSGHVPQTNGTINRKLEVVNLSKNRFTGSITVNICKVPSIRVLDLSQNKFSGVIPSSLGSLRHLDSLHLHKNRFSGSIPVSLRNLTELVTMDLGNNMFTDSIPLWIGEKLSKLKFLNLQSNKFIGKIPPQLCQLNSLQYLSLAHNSIIGMIPRCFGNLSGMINDQTDFDYQHDEYEENILASMKGIELVYTKTINFLASLDLSSNNITGEIPDALMNLGRLKNLNLSRNQLKGHVPMMIGNLIQMESLDLSMNMLSGRIPQSLTSLTFLSYLNLSFNNLSGAIPVGNQLQTLVNPSIYEGNDGLCGPPLSWSCNENKSPYNHVSEDRSQDDDHNLWFYFGMGPGFVIGFMGLLGSLHFIRSWRVAYFDALENVCSWLTVSVLVNLARLKRTYF